MGEFDYVDAFGHPAVTFDCLFCFVELYDAVSWSCFDAVFFKFTIQQQISDKVFSVYKPAVSTVT